MSTAAITARLRWKRWLFLLLAVAGLYILLPQLGIFHLSWRLLRHARWADVLLVAGFTALTYLAAAATYCLLAMRRLRYGRTVLLQLAGTFANRLLPAGVGGIGVNYAYARKAGHSQTQAAGLVAVNNSLGFIGHLALLGVALLFWHGHSGVLRAPSGADFGWLDRVLAGLVIIALLTARRWRQRLAEAAHRLLKQMLVYRRRPWRLAASLLTSICLTLSNMIGLYASALAIGVHLGVLAVFLVFTLGVGLGTVTPTPGGLGGVEAGLVAGLVAYHVSSADALAIALMYRLVSYWLALIVGAGAFVVAERRGYF